MNKRLSYLLGVIGTVAAVSVILFLPVPSILRWQSNFLARALMALLLCAFLCLYRILRGPTAVDRAVAIDMLGILIVGFCSVLSLPTGRDWYIDIGIVWALQSFIGIMALSKYLGGQDFDD
ncbi:MAG: monovalent cation/H+ antiporter complex subunit F [Candidatus Omnitrophota bacterium]|jgi:multicomponent Na+:H+ antiporter subunit F